MNDRTRYEIENFDSEGVKLAPTILTNDGSKKDTFESCGLLAQDVLALETVCCNNEMFVNSNNVDKMGIKYETLIAPLIKAIQELTARIEILEAV